MNFSVSTSQGQTVVTPAGDIDLNNAHRFQLALRHALESQPPRLVVDLAKVPYMDSSGVATLVDALQNVRRYGGQLVICSLHPKVRSIFEITRLDDVFTIVGSLKEVATN
jgi:anti-sigma B factor antagonist